MHRFYVPGSRAIGGRHVTLTRAPLSYVDGGTLAEPTVIRGVAIPAGSELYVDCDFSDIEVRLHGPVSVRGITVGPDVTLQFPRRGPVIIGVPLWAIPLFIVLLPWMFLRARLASREILVLRGGKARFAIRPDGTTKTL